jgi:LacI family transcriptional regulator
MSIDQIFETAVTMTDSAQTITIHDVAGRAGVSVSTVSNVLTGNRPVAESTRLHVLRVVEELGFRPNRMARGLVNRSSMTLGVVAAGLEYFGPSGNLVGIEQQASELGYSLILSLIHTPDTEDVEPVVANLLAHQVDGILWAMAQIGNNRRWWENAQRRVPVPVVFLNTDPSQNFVQVDIDNRWGGRKATEHLLMMGYRRIGLIAGPLNWLAARQRRDGWREALHEAGLAASDEQVVEGDWTARSGEQALARLLAQYPDMDAVFAGNDQMALGAMRFARERGLRIPADLGLVGYDDSPETEFYYPSLTTVRQQVIEQGRLAVRELARLITNPKDRTAKTALLEPELIVRASSQRC